MTPFATYIVETLVTLLAVVALAILVLVGARRFGIGRPLGPLDLVGRLPLEGRRAVYLVRVAQRIFILGASEAGIEKLGELDPESIQVAPDDKGGFRDVLAKVLAGRQQASSSRSTDNGSDDVVP
jgi:flagellar biogenesis protein FliO